MGRMASLVALLVRASRAVVPAVRAASRGAARFMALILPSLSHRARNLRRATATASSSMPAVPIIPIVDSFAASSERLIGACSG